ncbi:uncharacterized protein VP01_53g5 [Puccinia sorghi]|uniref:Retrotransposon gag domain-containing protein n=1 Tax=Puccinia sorghi TaxID=27349 RepID=A0A0L6UKK6_9BASI|nr:uncharacterized protein VP01_53g5 [Puccinia sorghi]
MTPTAPVTAERVDALAGEVSRIQIVMARIMSLMENSPMFRDLPPDPPPQPPHGPLQPAGSLTGHREAPPHVAPQESSGIYRAPVAAEFDHLSRMEPLKIKDLWFSGDSAHLLSFLRHVRDFLRPRSSLFQSESRRVVWISRHFGYHPAEHRKTPSPVENWYNSLIIDNARQQGELDVYADLDGKPFIHPTLVCVASFLDGLIAIFGDKFMKENAKRALKECKQGKLTIGEYNSKFSSLVYLVEDVEDSRIEKYVSGLNPRIIRQAMGKEWLSAKSLATRMALASEAAAQLDLLSLLPPDSTSLPHYPLSSNRPAFNSAPPPRPTRDPDAMEIDATRVIPAFRSLLDASRAICRVRNLCFRCLSPVIPGTHTGSLNCPNAPVSTERRQARLDRTPGSLGIRRAL